VDSVVVHSNEHTVCVPRAHLVLTRDTQKHGLSVGGGGSEAPRSWSTRDVRAPRKSHEMPISCGLPQTICNIELKDKCIYSFHIVLSTWVVGRQLHFQVLDAAND